MLTMDTSDLNLETVSNSLKFLLSFTQFGQSNVDGRSESCSEVSWARSDVAELVAVGKSGHTLNVGCSL